MTPLHLLATFLVLSAFLTVLLASPHLRRSVCWGAGWGVVMSLWLVAPRMVHVHHLHPATLQHWLVVVGFFVSVGAVLGALLVSAATWPVALGCYLRRPVLRDAALAEGLWSACVLPPLYIGLSIWIEWTNFARPPALGDSIGGPLVVGGFASAVGVCYLVYRHVTARSAPPCGPHLVRLLAVLALSGVVVLPWRIDVGPAAETYEDAPLHARSDAAAAAPLLVIGLDGGNWATLDPLIARGTTPVLAGLKRIGVAGQVEALWPPYWSGPAWGAIFTGYSQAEIGVYEDLAATAPGLPAFQLPLSLDLRLNPLFGVEFQLIRMGIIRPMPMPRTQLRRTPVWERLERTGKRTAVFRLPFTYPAVGQTHVVVSNVVSTDLWEMAGVSSDFDAPVVSPDRHLERVKRRFAEPHPRAPEIVRRIFPDGQWRKPADAIIDPLDVLATMVDISEKTFDSMLDIISTEPSLDVVIALIGSFDNICHAFWPYRFPEQFPENPPSDDDVRVLGPVIDRYLEYLDERLGQVMAAFPNTPNVLVVADHGQEASRGYPLWKGWHSRFGLFLAGGPGIRAQHGRVAVSYYDIVPTMLALVNLESPADLSGRSVVSRPDR